MSLRQHEQHEPPSITEWKRWVADVATLVDRGHVGTPDAASILAKWIDNGNNAGYVVMAVGAGTEQWNVVREHLVDNGYVLSNDGTQIEPCRQEKPLLLLTDGGIRIAPNGRLRRIATANHTDWGLDVEAAIGTEIQQKRLITVKFLGIAGTKTVPYYGVLRNDITNACFLKFSEKQMWDIKTIDYIDVPAESRAH